MLTTGSRCPDVTVNNKYDHTFVDVARISFSFSNRVAGNGAGGKNSSRTSVQTVYDEQASRVKLSATKMPKCRNRSIDHLGYPWTESTCIEDSRSKIYYSACHMCTHEIPISAPQFAHGIHIVVCPWPFFFLGVGRTRVKQLRCCRYWRYGYNNTVEGEGTKLVFIPYNGPHCNIVSLRIIRKNHGSYASKTYSNTNSL